MAMCYFRGCFFAVRSQQLFRLYLNASTLNVQKRPCKTSLKPDARPQEAEGHSASSRWKHIASTRFNNPSALHKYSDKIANINQTKPVRTKFCKTITIHE